MPQAAVAENGIFETTKISAAQFASQGHQAERSETKQGKSRASIGDTYSSRTNADVVE